MHSTHLNGQAAIALGQHGLSVGADGRFYAQNSAGENVQLQFDNNGRAVLPDGTTVQASEKDGGTELSVFNNGVENEATDNYLVQSLCAGELSVAHSDTAHTALDSIKMSSNGSGDLHAQAFDAQGRKTYAEDWNGNLLKTTNFDARTQDVSGFSVSQPTADNGNLTKYFDRDSNALGATYSQLTDNGLVSAVYNAQGQAVSFERDAFNFDGSYSVTNANFSDDGSIYNAQTNNFDGTGLLISTTPIDASVSASFAGDVSNSIGPITMPKIDDISNTMVCPVAGYAPPPGAEVIALGAARAAEAAAAEENNRRLAAAAATPAADADYRRAALEATSTVWSNNGAVVPDGNVFGHSASSGAQEVTFNSSSARYDVATEAVAAQSAAAAQAAAASAAASTVAYSQSSEVGNSYATPVTTSSVEVVPPISVGGSDSTYTNYGRDSVDASDYSPSYATSGTSYTTDGSSYTTEGASYAGGSYSTDGASYSATGASYSTDGSSYSASGASYSTDGGSYSAGGANYSTVQVDQDISNVKASDAAHRIAFDASPTSYQSVDQSVDHSVSYGSNASYAANASSSFETTMSLHAQPTVYAAQSSSSLMDQVSQARSENAFRAVEAHNMAAEVRSQIVPDSQQSVISNAGLSQQVQQGYHQSEYYAAPAASTFVEPNRAVPNAYEYQTASSDAHSSVHQGTTHHSAAAESSSVYSTESGSAGAANTSNVAERIAFDAAPTSYRPVDQSVEYNSSSVTHQHETPSLMDQVVAARKESALQTNDSYKSELKRELIPNFAPKDTPVQIWAAARTRQNSQPAQPGPKKTETRSLNSLIDAKHNKRQAPPAESKPEVLSLHAELAPPPHANHAVEVPTFLGRLRDSVEPDAVLQSTNQSLEQQLMNSSNRNNPTGGNAFRSALGRANAARVSSNSSSEHLNNVLVSYHTISSLIQAGKVYEAQAVANCALDSLSQCNSADPQVVPLVQAFVQLFEQKNMPTHAAAFKAKEQSFAQLATAGADFARNVWGA